MNNEDFSVNPESGHKWLSDLHYYYIDNKWYMLSKKEKDALTPKELQAFCARNETGGALNTAVPIARFEGLIRRLRGIGVDPEVIAIMGPKGHCGPIEIYTRTPDPFVGVEQGIKTMKRRKAKLLKLRQASKKKP